MANKFVWSGAGGSNDGSSWDNAYTSLMRDWGAEAGFTPATDYVYVRSVHSETSATTVTVTGADANGASSMVRVICVVGDTTGTTPGNLASGASVNTNNTSADIDLNEAIYIYGVSFLSNDDIHLGISGSNHNLIFESCRLELIGTQTSDFIWVGPSSDVACEIHFSDVILDFNNASQGLRVQRTSLTWAGGSVAYDVNRLIPILLNPYPCDGVIVGVDFTALSSSQLIDGATYPTTDGDIVFERCLLATGMTLVSGTISATGFRVSSYHCQIGTDADPSYQMEIQDSRGKVSANTAKYRTGGASDGVRSTPVCWDVDTTVGSARGYPGHAFECPPITAWTAGDGATAHTYRVAFASDATINDDELWMELEGPNDAATNSLAALKTTRVAPMTTAAACTTDGTSSWTGTGVGTKQYMQVTYTPDKPGPVTVRVMMAKASDNIYVDPKIQIDPA